MSKLTKLLEYANESQPGERKSLRNKPSFKKEVTSTLNKSQKELLLSDELESSTLLQTEVLDTIIKGATQYRCMRDLIPQYNITTNQLRIVYQDDVAGTASEIPEGGKIEIDSDSLSHANLDIKKVGTRPLITKELIEDGLWDVVEMQLERAGARVENKFNIDGMTAMLDSKSEIDATDSTLDIKDIAKAMKTVRTNGFIPTHVVLHPTAEGELMQSDYLLRSDYSGSNDLLRNGSIGKLFGLKSYLYSLETGDWDDEAGNVYAWVGDPQSYAGCAIRRPIAVEEYDDPIHDLMGISVTMRYGFKKINNNAGVFIEKQSS
jgi:HK97 family phage major capsid protein